MTEQAALGVSRSVLLRREKATKGKPRSKPDRGNPAVRDCRGACGIVAMGVGLRSNAKALAVTTDSLKYMRRRSIPIGSR